MKGRFRVKSLKLKADKRRYIFFFFLFLIFTFHSLLSTSTADTVRSRSVVVIDTSKGDILYAKNPHLKCPPASTTKLMTAIVTLENKDLSDMVTISRNASQTPPHKAGLKEGDRISVENLLYALLINSANDAAVALAEAVAGSEANFVKLMNKKAVSIGAKNTKFINASGLPGSGQYTTAYDLAKIMRYSLRNPKMKEIIGTRVARVETEEGDSIFLRNTNKLLWTEDSLVGGKTGYTRRAMHCFVCAAERNNDTVIVSILGNPSRNSLWKETEQLIAKGFKIKENKEPSIIYLTKTSYDNAHIKKTSHEKIANLKKKNSKNKTNKKLIAKKKTKDKKYIAKKKVKTKKFAKKKSIDKKKNYRIARKKGNDRTEG
ncbi:MAG: D-alanyl-D-alanine carboxypeptidase [Nitrospirae bacterium]|nr:D-alanyl-D-alanine carboxypeptidase [Nitrospirota bacterium]